MKTAIMAYALYLIFMPLLRAVSPSLWRQITQELLSRSDARIRQASLLSIALGLALLLFMVSV